MIKVGSLIRILTLIFLNGDLFILPSSNFIITDDNLRNDGRFIDEDLSLPGKLYDQPDSDILFPLNTGCSDDPNICGPSEACLPAQDLRGICVDEDQYNSKSDDALGQPQLDKRDVDYALYPPVDDEEPPDSVLSTESSEYNDGGSLNGPDYKDQLDGDENGYSEYPANYGDFIAKRAHGRYGDTDYPEPYDTYDLGRFSKRADSTYFIEPRRLGQSKAALQEEEKNQEEDFNPVQLFYENPPEESETREGENSQSETERVPPSLGKREASMLATNYMASPGAMANGQVPVSQMDYFYHDKKDENDPFPKRYDEPKKGTTITEDYSMFGDGDRSEDYAPDSGKDYDSRRLVSMPLSYTIANSLNGPPKSSHPLSTQNAIAKQIPGNRLSNPNDNYAFVLADFAFIRTKHNISDQSIGYKMLAELAKQLKVPLNTFSHVKINGRDIIFKVNPNLKLLNASLVAYYAHFFKPQLENAAGGIKIVSSGIGSDVKVITTKARRTGDAVPPAPVYEDGQTVALIRAIEPRDTRGKFLALAACLAIMLLVLALLLIYISRSGLFNPKNKYGGQKGSPSRISQLALFSPTSQNGVKNESGEGYYSTKPTHGILATFLGKRGSESKPKTGEMSSPPDVKRTPGTAAIHNSNESSNRSSTSSWSEEKALTKMDITTGHVVLSYMEKHILNRDLLDQEWASCETYVPVPMENLAGVTADVGSQEAYLAKLYLDEGVFADETSLREANPYKVLPYPFNRVKLKSHGPLPEAYINASYITEHDPRFPSYIATQNPLKNTLSDFWRMVWDNGICIIVNLTRPEEINSNRMAKYWPDQGVEVYSVYEVHLVSEHMWCEDYIVRSFYLKNLQSNETRTLTQFHYLAWPDMSLPRSTKSLLDFRRKVNKSYKGRSTPVVVHCSDGSGRTGIYMLIDMLLCRLTKGVKEIDIVASVEHLRDQRMKTVATKAQFEFAFLAVSEEVQVILKALAGSATPTTTVTKRM